MNYYVIEITKYNDGTKDAFAIYSHDTRDGAIKVYHQKMASAIGAEKIASELIQIIDDNGILYMTDKYERTEEETTE